MLSSEMPSERTQVRLPAQLKIDLLASAQASGRTLNGEIIERLLKTFLLEMESFPTDVSVIKQRDPAISESTKGALELTRDDPNEDYLRTAVAAATTELGRLTKISRKFYSTEDGKIVRFVVSSPWRGKSDTGYFKFLPAHFKDDFLCLTIRGFDKVWLIPMLIVRSVLEGAAVPQRSNGEKSWDPMFGIRKGRESFWYFKDREVDISQYAIDQQKAADT